MPALVAVRGAGAVLTGGPTKKKPEKFRIMDKWLHMGEMVEQGGLTGFSFLMNVSQGT